MKKTLKYILITISLLTLLTACSKDVKTHVSDKDSVIVEIKGSQITKDDIYEYGKLRFGQNILTVNLVDMLLEENITLNDDDIKRAKDLLEDAKEALKDDFEAIIKASGYKDVDDYYERFVLRNIKNEKLIETYTRENIEEITNGLSTQKIRVLKAEDKANAEAAIKELEAIEDLDSEKFLEIAKKYSKEEVVAPLQVEHVYSDRTTNKHYNTYLKDAKAGLIAETIMVDEGFEIIFVEELDTTEDLDMIIASIEKDEKVNEIVTKATYAHYSAKGDFKIHDADLYKAFKENNPFIVK